MSEPGSKRAPEPNTPTWADTPTRDAIPRPDFEANAVQAVSARYDIVSELGRGGMGLVLKARDRETDEIVALKLLQPDISASPQWEQRFKDELRLARKITHKNVCRVYELLRFGETAAIAMEYVEGETLRRVMRRFGGLPLRKAIEVMTDICGGLKEAHAQGVVHRDLKPENVMIDGAGNIHIMDFGLARSAAENIASGASRGITGTPEYMSPEQASGKPADARSDIYALGLILFELLTGRAPFSGDSAMTVALKHVNDPPPAPREIDPTIPHYIERAILRCLEKNPEKRFQAVEELEAALQSKHKVKEAVAFDEEPDDVPLPAHLLRWQAGDNKVLIAAACAVAVFFGLFSRFTPYHYAQFLSPSAAVDSATRTAARLGLTMQSVECRPIVSISNFERLAYHTDPSWLESNMPNYASATYCVVTPATGTKNEWEFRQDGKISRMISSVRPPVLPPEGKPEELKRALDQLGRELTGVNDRELQLRAAATGTRVTLVAQDRPHVPDGSISIATEKLDWPRQYGEFQLVAGYWARQPWQSFEWRHWDAIPAKLLIAAMGIAVLLFFIRRLQRRPPARAPLAIAIATTVVLATSIGPQVRYALQQFLPRSVIYAWQGLTQTIFPDWAAITDRLMIAAVDVFLLLVLCAVTLTVRYYGRRGDPVRTWVMFRYAEGWKTSLALAGIRGLLLGACLAAGFVLLLTCTRWTQSVFADTTWIGWLISDDWRPFVPNPWVFAWKIFGTSILEACAAGFLIAFPACVAARAGAKSKVVVATAALFWIIVQFSALGMTTADQVYAVPSIVLQGTFVALVYWHFDLAAAMATVFFGEMFAMGYAAYQTFRSLDPMYYVPSLFLWGLVAATAVVMYFRPQVSGGLKSAAKVFE